MNFPKYLGECTILGRKDHPYNQEMEIILVEIVSKPTQWVTYMKRKDKDTLFWGHYFFNKDTALADFKNRGEEDFSYGRY